MPLKRKRNYTAITVDRETYAQVTAIAKFFNGKTGKRFSRTDVVRMGITAILVLHPKSLNGATKWTTDGTK